MELSSLEVDSSLINRLSAIDGVSHLQMQITKNALLKTETDFEGILVKGVDANYNWDFITEHLVEGVLPNFNSTKKSNEIAISKSLSAKLQLQINDQAFAYFQGLKNNNALIRKFTVKAIYETGIEFFDDVYIFADSRHLQKINNWNSNQCSSLELLLNKNTNKEQVYLEVERESPYDTSISNAKELYPQIFDWINLFDLNTLVILLIMILVASINMISSLLIIILERTKMIGLLKSLGAHNYSIRKIFLYHAFYLLRRGLLIGNGIGLVLIGIQYYFELIQLDPKHYYVKALPVSLSLENWLFINLGSILICMLMLIIPSILIQKVEPIKALRYE
jgi:lipoprotein-releasing system permease protein